MSSINVEKTTLKESIIRETTLKDDEIEVVTDDQNFVPLWDLTTESGKEMPYFPDEIEPIEDVAHLKKNPKNKIVIMKAKEEKRSLVPYLLVVVGAVGATLAVLVARRKKESKSRRFRSGSYGGSASDVRFLTSDEILDLNLDYE